MEFNLEVHLNIDETGLLARGRFLARKREEMSNVAYQYIQSIKRETGYHSTLIEKVIVNGTEDITEEVKKNRK